MSEQTGWKFLNFDLQIKKAETGYEARVGLPTAKRPTVTNFFDFSEELNELVRSFREQDIDRKRFQRMGSLLFDPVFAGDLHELYRNFEEEADAVDAVLRIRLNLAAVPELAGLPWEYLYDGKEFTFTSIYRSLVRSPILHEQRRKPIKLPLRILIMGYAPPEMGRLDLEREIEKIEEGLEELRSRDAIELQVMHEPTLSQLQSRLRKSDIHVFHYLGHGTFDAKAGDGLLFFKPDANDRRQKNAAGFDREPRGDVNSGRY